MIPAWQLKQLELSFKILDSAGDGFITAQQAAQFLSQQVAHDLDVRALQDIIYEVNTKQMGLVDFTTLTKLFEEAMENDVRQERLQQRLNKDIEKFDTCNEGVITAAQLRSAVEKNSNMKNENDVTTWLKEKQFEPGDKIKYRLFFERKRSIERCERQFTTSEIRRYKEAFCQFDVNNDGIISTDEVERLLKIFGVHLSKQTVHNMIAEVDGDDKGFVDYLEFLTFLNVHMDEQTDFEKMVDTEFRKYDVYGEGFVTVSELRDVLGKYCVTMTAGELDEFLYDSNFKDSDQINYKQYFTREPRLSKDHEHQQHF